VRAARLVARASDTITQFTKPEVAANAHELGGYLHLDAAPASWLRLGARALVRVSVECEGARVAPGIVLGLDASGAF